MRSAGVGSRLLWASAGGLSLIYVRALRSAGPRPPMDGEGVRTCLDDLIASSSVLGIQYLVVNSSGVLFEYTGGWADISLARAMRPTTTLMAYSMSKTITAAAVLRLADDGRLGLDDSVGNYVDSLPYGADFTVRQLLTHTSGIPAPIPLRWVHLATEHERFGEKAALGAQLQKNNTLSSAPGEKYSYSNLGYWLLGPVVERASDQAFSTYVAEHVFRPLGVPAAELGYAASDPNRHATGYLEKYSFLNLVKRFVINGELIGNYHGRWLQMNPHYVDGPAFGGVVGTARGFGRFLQDQLCPRSVLFGEQTRSVFYRPASTRDGAEVPMTAGWHIGDLNGVRQFYKEGGGGGFHSMMRIYPDRGIGTVVLTNATAYNVGRLLDTLDARFLA